MKLDLTIDDLELFICEKKQLIELPLLKVYKKSLFNPFSLFLNVK